MASSLYKSFLIVTAADYIEDKLEWKAWVTISWKEDGRQYFHTIKDAKQTFKTAPEAERFALSIGQNWVDARR